MTPSRSLWSPETMARDTKLSLCRIDPKVGQAVCCCRLGARLCGGIRAGLLMRHTLHAAHSCPHKAAGRSRQWTGKRAEGGRPAKAG